MARLNVGLAPGPESLSSRGAAQGHHSNDDAAVVIAGRFSLKIGPHPHGGLAVHAAAGELHDFVCEMGRRDVSVTLLEQDVHPLTALFYELTEQKLEPVGAL